MSDNITISGANVTIIKAGVARIKAIQNGNDAYNAAQPIEISFCINPARPSITLTGLNTLVSSNSNGNQWYKNTDMISGATQQTLSVTESGKYTVITTAESCSSLLSDAYTITITGISYNPEFSVDVYPNPTRDFIYVHVKGNDAGSAKIEIVDMLGRVVDIKTSDGLPVTFDIADYTNGLYFVDVISHKHRVTRKIVKK
jgi:hypothetical protein